MEPHSATPAELRERLEAEQAGVAFLLYRDGDGRQIVHPLEGERMTVGRGMASDVLLAWDAAVSRVHAELERKGEEWTVVDDGLSANGTFVNGERLGGRRRLADRDSVRCGSTTLVFRCPAIPQTDATVKGADAVEVALTDMQLHVLVALARPYAGGAGFATPATNGDIAREVHLSVDAVKSHLRTLFQRFGIEGLPQNQKRARLVELALQGGVIGERDLAR